MNIWQVAAGDGSRDYADVFLQFGVLLAGPGDAGPYDRCPPGTYDAWTFIRAMAAEVQVGDLVALKRPHGKQWEVVAVGKVTGPYEWLENFEDVEGWDLQHARRIEWRLPGEPIVVDGLTRGTLKQVHGEAVRERLVQEWERGRERKPTPLPPMPEVLIDESLVPSLLDHGLRAADAESVASTIRRVRRVAGWYLRRGRDVSEHETRTFLVVPLILALGWPEQRIKIEWNDIDVALFDRAYEPEKAQPIGIVETKKLHAGLGYAEAQAQEYAKRWPSCSKIVVTDGVAYKLLGRDAQSWKLLGVMNIIRRPRREHPYLQGVGGAEAVFRALLP